MTDLAILNDDSTITVILEGIEGWNLDKPLARACFESDVTEAVQRHVAFMPPTFTEEEMRQMRESKTAIMGDVSNEEETS